jgi:hypothetical protein
MEDERNIHGITLEDLRNSPIWAPTIKSIEKHRPIDKDFALYLIDFVARHGTVMVGLLNWMEDLNRLCMSTPDSWSRNDMKAFWINLYGLLDEGDSVLNTQKGNTVLARETARGELQKLKIVFSEDEYILLEYYRSIGCHISPGMRWIMLNEDKSSKSRIRTTYKSGRKTYTKAEVNLALKRVMYAHSDDPVKLAESFSSRARPHVMIMLLNLREWAMPTSEPAIIRSSGNS